jgi:hypothetical protein
LNVRALAIAVLAAWAILSFPARATGLDDASAGTRWGESPEELQRHFGARGFALPQPIDFGDSYAPLVVRDVSVGGFSMIAYYQIDKVTHGLKRIQLERPRHMVNAGAFRGVFMALDAEYGAPDKDCGTLPGPTTAYQGAAEYVWQRDGGVIRAIFRDTTLEALNGCYSPACGLTAQLLIRISPPAEDRGACPPLPSGAQLRAPR